MRLPNTITRRHIHAPPKEQQHVPSSSSSAVTPYLPPQILRMVFEYYIPAIINSLVIPIRYGAEVYRTGPGRYSEQGNDDEDSDDDSSSDEAISTIPAWAPFRRFLTSRLKFKSVSNRFTRIGNRRELDRTTRGLIREARLPLIHFVLVCRSWYLVAIDYLYTYPVVPSSRQLLAFNHILRRYPVVRKAQDLAYVHDRMSSKGIRTFGSVIASSAHLNTLTIILGDHLIVEDEHLSYFGDAFSRIRKLTIQGCYRWELWTSFPALETLCLRDMRLTPTKLGPLHCSHTLHTLQLVNVNVDYLAFLAITGIKTLHTLELYSTKNGGGGSTHRDFAHCLQIANHHLTNVKHLILGVVDGHSAKAFRDLSWRAPPNLMSMTVLVDISPKRAIRHVASGGEEQFELTWTFHELKSMLAGLSNCRSSLNSLCVILQWDFFQPLDDDGDDGCYAQKTAIRDASTFLRPERSEEVEQVALDAKSFLDHAHRLGIRTVPFWYDLNGFMNHRLCRRPDSSDSDSTSRRRM